jgi:tetratricopeptide (TPR) repeat protein
MLEAGRADSALALFATATRLAPSDGRAYRALVRVHDHAGSLWEGARTLELLALRFPDLPEPHTFMGEIELLRGRHEAALIEFEKALRVDPRHAQSLAGVARCRAALGNLEQALEYFDKLLKARPHDPSYRYGRAVALGLAGETRAAATQFKWAIRLAPRSWLAERDYARLLSAEGERLDLAIRHFERAIELLDLAGDPATAAEVEGELEAVRARHGATPEPDDAP